MPRATEMAAAREAAALTSAEESPEKKRRWYQIRRVRGGACLFVAAVIAASPAAPLFAIGALSITTHSAAAGLAYLGTYVFGVGKGRKDEREGK